MSESAISICHLRKSFGKHTVLSDVCLEIPTGQTVALLGRNGTGKTTLIRTLLGLLPADQGEIRVAGWNPVTQPIELRRHVGYLAEDQTMYGWMTATELCRFLDPFYPTWDTHLAERYLTRFEIPPHVRIERLSKGQSVKLGLVVALAHAPAVAILDDPALGLDSVSRKEFNRDLVEHLQAEGRTVIYSSHLLGEVEAVADQVAILDQGTIVRHAPVEQLQESVQRMVLPVDVVRQRPAPQGLLDARRRGEYVEIVVDGVSTLLPELHGQGLTVAPQQMSLDDIFEAFVIGRPAGWTDTHN